VPHDLARFLHASARSVSSSVASTTSTAQHSRSTASTAPPPDPDVVTAEQLDPAAASVPARRPGALPETSASGSAFPRRNSVNDPPSASGPFAPVPAESSLRHVDQRAHTGRPQGVLEYQYWPRRRKYYYFPPTLSLTRDTALTLV
jgi:hypothetical protein